MKRQRLLVVIAAFAITAVTAAAPALANERGVQRIPVAWETEPADLDGEVKVHHHIVTGRVEGVGQIKGHDFLAGTFTSTLTFQWNLLTGTGAGHATFHYMPTNYPGSGWTGTLDIHYSDIDFAIEPPWNSFNKQVAQGYGVFDGMTLRGIDTVTKGVAGHVAEGEILVPPSATVPSP